MMGHIFISYSHKDKVYVDKLAKTLESEGFQVWIDDRIHYGSEWPKVVERNLDTSDGVVIVMTKNSSNSDMVLNEVTRAREKKKPVFPLLLNGDNWLIVQTKQFLDVRDGSFPTEKFYKRLEEITPRKKRDSAYTQIKHDAKREVTREKVEREINVREVRENTKRSLQVFLCYASPDRAAIIKLYNRLKSDGVDPWLDEKNLYPGSPWKERIFEAIKSSDSIVVCLSPRLINREGYVQKEIYQALTVAEEKPIGTIFIIPVMIERCAVPHILSQWNYADMFFDGVNFDERGYKELLQSLTERAKQLGKSLPL